MKEQQIIQDKLRQRLILEEFRYWDYCRNNVCQKALEEIRDNINKLEAAAQSYYPAN
ncbi:MAG: hypothetical protein JWQ09_2096 [Segetibacter sp.]|nr:hypothetical protein [Segetibacter sp.]